jgi:hypothetical protein
MNEAMPTIEASGLTKRFGKTTALEGLDLVLRSCLIGALTTPDNTDTAGGDIINSTIQLRPDAVVRAAWVGERRALGRRTCGEVSFLVSLPLADTATQVGVVLVVLTTPLTFAVGSGLLALAVRRSRRWVRAALVAAALLAVVSAAGGPLPAADDLASGVLLAAMHLVTGAAFLVTAPRVGAR